MKPRTPGFLTEEKIDHNSEIFDYIVELHEYLWQFVRIIEPGASGSLSERILDNALSKSKNQRIK